MATEIRARRLLGPPRPVRPSHFESRPTAGWRWFALLAVSASVLQTWGAARGGALTLATFLDAHGGAFAPAPAAFALLGAIHVGLVVYVVAQLRARHLENRALDALAPLAGVASSIASLELVAAGEDLPWLVAALGIALVVATLALYLRAHRAIAAHLVPRWIATPFALWLAWSAVLVPAKLAAAGWSSDAAGVVLVAALAVLALAAACRYRDAAIAGAVAWLLHDVTAAGPEHLGGVAVMGAIACAVVAVVELVLTAFGAPAAPPAARVRTARARRAAVYQLPELDSTLRSISRSLS